MAFDRLIFPGLLALLVACGRTPTAAPTAYERDLAALAREEAAAGPGASPLARASLLRSRWALTGSTTDLADAWRAMAPALAVPERAPVELSLFAAALALDLHRVSDARRVLDACAGCAARPAGDVVAGDLALAEGRLDDAGAAYQRALGNGRRWDRLARLAHLRHVTGDDVAADALYAEAEDDVTAKEMRTFAWLEVQRGRLAFARGRFAAAAAAYDRAARAYPGYWLVEAHQAEVLAAEGRFAEAIALYTRAAARAGGAEVAQALAELHVQLGKPAEARPWIDRPASAYQASAARGEVHDFHHLAALYTDLSPDAAQAVRWAEKDVALRPGVAAAHDQLAWACFRAGRLPEARQETQRALALGAPDAHLLSHAAAIAIAAGDADEGGRLFRRAAEINPAFRTTFHAHP